MIFSKTSEHAIRVLSYIAVKEDGIYSVSFLSRELGIPFKYLTRLMTMLAKGGFVEPIKGRVGGFILLRPASTIYVNEILEAVDEYDEYEKCVLGFAECNDEHPCILHEKWKLIRENINQMLKNTTLAEFKNQQNIKL